MWRLELGDIDGFETPRHLYVAHFNLPASLLWRGCSAHGGVRAAGQRSLSVSLTQRQRGGVVVCLLHARAA
jgi:hypothetical protein